MKRFALLALLLAAGQAPAAGPVPRGAPDCPAPAADREPRARDLVVLVHGMGRTPLSMAPLARHLERAGYRVRNVGYSSYGPDVASIGRRVARETRAALAEAPAGRVHFVTHSLGGVVVRWVLAHERPERVGRVVMLAPPNQGAAIADRMSPWLGWLLRPMRELRTDPSGIVRRLPPAPGVPVLVIAGDDDGKVSPEEAHLDGAEAELVVDSGHTFIMLRPSVMRVVAAYLAGEVPAGAACPHGPSLPARAAGPATP
ncbi:MAG: lipase family alpha/beta hydrolase [Rubricoccaceae bacterium]